MKEKVAHVKWTRKDIQALCGIIVSLSSTAREKSDPLFEKRVTSITKAQQAFASIHGGIPCNLAPAHFTVHVVQVRLNFALGLVVEANPA